MPTSNAPIPNRLLANRRKADPQFDPDETLYRRCPQTHVDNGKVNPAAIEFPDYSVNRGRYSEPGDVLLEKSDGFVAVSCEVRDVPLIVPPEFKGDSSFEWTWAVMHEPLKYNFAHSEVRTYRDGVHSRKIKPPNGIKKWFRHVLSQRMAVEAEKGGCP